MHILNDDDGHSVGGDLHDTSHEEIQVEITSQGWGTQ